MTTAPDPAADIQAAERRVEAAKGRLSDDVHRLQAKLSPKALARDAAQAAADKGQDAVLAARANPLPVAGAALVTVLFLFRRRIAGLFRRKKKLTVPAQPKTPADTHAQQGDLS